MERFFFATESLTFGVGDGEGGGKAVRVTKQRRGREIREILSLRV